MCSFAMVVGLAMLVTLSISLSVEFCAIWKSDVAVV